MTLYNKVIVGLLWLVVLALAVLSVIHVPPLLFARLKERSDIWLVMLLVLSTPVSAFLACLVTLLHLQWERRISLLRFPSRSNMDAFLCELLKKHATAALHIDVANFTKYPPHSEEGRKYMEVIKRYVLSNSRIELRRLVTFPTVEKLMWANEWAKELHMCRNFRIRYLQDSCAETKLARFMPTFYIVNSRNLFVGFFDESEASLNLFLKNPGVAREFSAYFEVLWHSASSIKDEPLLEQSTRKSLFRDLLKVFLLKNAITKEEFEQKVKELNQ